MKYIVAAASLTLICVLTSCMTGPDPRLSGNPYALTPIRVQLSYTTASGAEGGGTVMFHKSVKSDQGSRSSRNYTLPAKVALDGQTRHAVTMNLDGRTVYGLLSALTPTQYTSVGSVRIEITEEQVHKALSGEVLQITVNDPTSSRTVVQLLVGDSPIDPKKMGI